MNRRIVLLGLAAVGLALMAAGYVVKTRESASSLPKVAIFNLLSHPILDASVKGIKDELIASGFGPDHLKIVDVSANGQMELLGAISAELVALKPRVIVPVSTPVTQSLFKAAPKDQMIVYSTVTNPDDVGMDKRPPNMTGVSDAVNYEANLDLIQELFPAAKTIGLIYNAGERNSQFGVDKVKEIAKIKGLTLLLATVSNSNEVADAARSLLEKVDVFYVGSDNTVVSALDGLLAVARERKIPVIASDSGSVEKGALAAVSVDYEKVGHAAGRIVVALLKGEKKPKEIEPIAIRGDLLLLNQEAANRLGYSFKDAIKTRAGKVLP